MKRHRGPKGRTEAEIRRLVAGYESGNQTKAAYCAAQGLPLTTLDYYRRRLRRPESALIEIDLRGDRTPAPHPPAAGGAVALVLRNGRRVEIGWSDLNQAASHSEPLRALLGWLEEA